MEYFCLQDDLENLLFFNDEIEFNLLEEIFEISVKFYFFVLELFVVVDEGIVDLFIVILLLQFLL